MMPIVIDASVAMAWCFEDEATAGSEAVLDRLSADDAVMPSLWRLELEAKLVVASRKPAFVLLPGN